MIFSERRFNLIFVFLFFQAAVSAAGRVRAAPAFQFFQFFPSARVSLLAEVSEANQEANQPRRVSPASQAPSSPFSFPGTRSPVSVSFPVSRYPVFVNEKCQSCMGRQSAGFGYCNTYLLLRP